MRINKFLAEHGIASRRHADEMIIKGRVKINGEVATLGTDVQEHDIVLVDDVPVSTAEKVLPPSVEQEMGYSPSFTPMPAKIIPWNSAISKVCSPPAIAQNVSHAPFSSI